MKAILVSLFVVLGFSAPVWAQSASEFFHSGAQSYVASELPDALNYVQSGLEKEPENSKLIALKEKIEEEMENQEQQGNNSEQSSDKNEQNQQEQDSDQQQESENEEEQEQDSESEEKEGEPGEESENEDDSQNSPKQESPPDPNQLSKEQAERILQALENEEAKLLREVQKIKGRPRRVEKDW